MDSKIGLIIQLAGVSLITLLTLFLRRSLATVALKHWTNAWLFLSCALFCLRLAFSYETYSTQLYSFYFLSEYLFGFLLLAGCRGLGKTGELPFRQEILILPFIIVAFGLPFVSDDFSVVQNLHSIIMSVFLLVAFVELWRTRIGSFGWNVMLIALGFLSIDYLQYFVLFAVRQIVPVPTELTTYNPVIDLVLQILLGFGMVIVLLELVLADFKQANDKLQAAHEKLEELAHIDPLTTALNRHAFHGFVKRRGSGSMKAGGTIGFFDVDDLKSINDVHGHAVGDIAIRAVVRAIRELIRSDDLIFRWGGDEFFVLMIGFDAKSATRRMERIDSLLTGIRVEGVYRPLTLGVSFAFTDFDDIANIDAAIQDADAKMYHQKQIRKMYRGTPLFPPPHETSLQATHA